jgi:hypothetical protein
MTQKVTQAQAAISVEEKEAVTLESAYEISDSFYFFFLIQTTTKWGSGFPYSPGLLQ